MAQSGVNVKMGVSGVAQFKQNISAAQQSLKTLDAQLALTEKQFKASGDSETYMEEKAQLLQMKLQEQKAIISNTEDALRQMAENGIDKGSKAFQDMQRQLINAKSGLIDTENAMNGITEEGEEAANSVSSVNQQLKRIGDGVNFDNVTNGLDKINGSIQGVITKAFRMGQALLNNTLGAAGWADDLITRSNQWGVSLKELQQMDKVAALVDTDTDTILGAQDRMVKSINGGKEEVMGFFANMGLDPAYLAKSKDGITTLFWEAGRGLMNMTDEAAREEAAMNLFGKSWRDLAPLFMTGRKEYESMMAEQHVLSDDQINNLGKMDDAMQKLNNEWDTFKQTIFATLAEGLTPLLETLNGLMSQFNEYLASDEGQEMLKALADAVKSLFENLTTFKPEEAIAKFKDVFDKVKDGFQWIIDNKDTIETALKVIAGGFGLLKISGLAMNTMKLVNGFKGLLGVGGVNEATTAGTMTTASGGFGSTLAALGIPALFAAAWGWAINERKNNPYVRGGEGAVDRALGNTELQNAFAEWILSNRAAEANPFDEAAVERMNRANAALYNMPGGQDVMSAYSDWRQWNMMSNTDWAMPTGDQWTNLTASMDRMNAEADLLTGETEKNTKATDKMADAAEGLKGIPAEVREAVISGMSGIKIIIDGREAGAAVTPYVADNLGGMALRLMVPQ